MSFKVLIEDDEGIKHVLHEIDDRRITRVGLTTRNGEAAGARIDADMTEVLLTFEWVQQDGRPTIQDVEALQHPTMTGDQVQERINTLSELPSATNSGHDNMLEAQRRQQAETVMDNGPSEPSPVHDADEGSTGDDESPAGEFKLA